MSNDNGKKPPPPEGLHVERSHVMCKGCHAVFEHFTIEEIDGLVQLRCGEVLITRLEMACLRCGRLFYWNIKEKDVENMALKYGELMVVIKGYNPE